MKVVTPSRDEKHPYTQRQLLEAIKALHCDGTCNVLPASDEAVVRAVQYQSDHTQHHSPTSHHGHTDITVDASRESLRESMTNHEWNQYVKYEAEYGKT